jgi:outer membrane receptor protein involved in Fe transport
MLTRRSSNHTANLDIQYSAPFGNNGMIWFVGGNSSYRSMQYMDEVNVAYVPERIITNLSLGVDHDKYSVTLREKNVFDEDASEFAQIFQTDFNSILPAATIVGIPRRRFGATARFHF